MAQTVWRVSTCVFIDDIVQATVDKLMDLRQAATDEGFELNVRVFEASENAAARSTVVGSFL